MLRHSVSALFSTRLAGIWHLAINSNTGYQWLPFCPSFADWEIFDYLWLFYTSQNFPKHILQICQKPWQNLLQFSRRVKPIQYTSATQKYQFSFRCKHLEVWYGLVWFGGVFGMVWYGLVWFGMVWYGLVVFIGEQKFFERGIPVLCPCQVWKRLLGPASWSNRCSRLLNKRWIDGKMDR